MGAVKGFMGKKTSIKKVVFNVFKEIDKEIYSRLLGQAALQAPG